MLKYDQGDIDRFMRHVDRLPCGCWFWTGARSRGRGNRKWYGSFRVKGRTVRAHRFSDEVIAGRGPLPRGQHRDHKCEFSLCVNPDCMERVTHEENQRRKHERRTTRRREELCPGGQHKGPFNFGCTPGVTNCGHCGTVFGLRLKLEELTA